MDYLCAVNVIIMRGHGQRKSIVVLLGDRGRDRDDLVIDRDCPFAATTVNNMLMKDAFIKLRGSSRRVLGMSQSVSQSLTRGQVYQTFDLVTTSNRNV